MRFSVYIRRHGMLHKVLKFHRGAKGLYMVTSRDRDTYTTYHEDGRYWIRVAGQKAVKSLREPLRAFRGSETLTIVYAVFDDGPSPLAIDPNTVRVRPEDIVLDHAGRVSVGVEVILSDHPLELEPMPQRLAPRIFVKCWNPLLTLEAFALMGNVLSGYRFHRPPQAMYHGANMPPRI